MSVEYGEGYGNILHRGKQDQEYANHPPTMKLNYTYKYPFEKMIIAYMQKYHWQDKWQLTTIVGAKQIDEDTFVYLRRHETILNAEPTFERVYVNRKSGVMQGFTLGRNSDGTEVFPSQVQSFHKMQYPDFVQNSWWIYQGSDKSLRVQNFKDGIKKTIEAIKFSQMEAEN